MAGAMHQLGYLSSGVDLSSEQISLARSKNPGPNYQVGDMACLPAGTYDLLLNLYTSFGYYKSEQEDLSILSQWRQSLRPGGVLLMELADMDRARNRIPPNGELNRHTGDVEEVLLMDWSARLLTVEYLSGKHQWKCITRLYEKEVLRNSLLNAGFSQVELFGGFDFREKANDDNLIILARN
jgi:SAM-dependent methyltransferase